MENQPRTFKFGIKFREWSKDGEKKGLFLTPPPVIAQFRGYADYYNACVELHNKMRDIYRAKRSAFSPTLSSLEEAVAAKSAEIEEIREEQKKKNAHDRKRDNMGDLKKATLEKLKKERKSFAEDLKKVRELLQRNVEWRAFSAEHEKEKKELFADLRARRPCNGVTRAYAEDAANDAQVKSKNRIRFKAFRGSGTVAIEYHAPSLSEDDAKRFRQMKTTFEERKKEIEKLFVSNKIDKEGRKSSFAKAREEFDLACSTLQRERPQKRLSEMMGHFRVVAGKVKFDKDENQCQVETPSLRANPDSPDGYSLRRSPIKARMFVRGTGKDDPGAWAEFDLVPHQLSRDLIKSNDREIYGSWLHPDLDPDAEVMGAYIKRVKVANRFDDFFYLCVRLPKAKLPTRDLKGHLHLFPHNGGYVEKGDGKHVLVATSVDDEGKRREWYIPHEVTRPNGKKSYGPLNRMEHADSLAAFEERNMELARDQIADWLQEKLERDPEFKLPDWFVGLFRENKKTVAPTPENLRRWKSAPRLVRLMQIWRNNRIDGDEPIFRTQMAPREALAGDGDLVEVTGIPGFVSRFITHYYYWRIEETQKAVRYRDELYKIFARKIADEGYETVTMPDIDRANRARKEKPEDDEAKGSQLRQMEKRLAFSYLQRYVKSAVEKEGTIFLAKRIELDAAGTNEQNYIDRWLSGSASQSLAS